MDRKIKFSAKELQAGVRCSGLGSCSGVGFRIGGLRPQPCQLAGGGAPRIPQGFSHAWTVPDRGTEGVDRNDRSSASSRTGHLRSARIGHFSLAPKKNGI